MPSAPAIRDGSLQFAECLKQAPTVNAAWKTFETELGCFGISQSLYGYQPTPPKNSMQSEMYYFSSYDTDFITAYEEQNCLGEEWSILHCMESTEVIRWGDPCLMACLSERQIEIEQIGWDFGLHEGMTVPLRGPVRSSWGGAGLSATDVSAKEWTNTLKYFQGHIEMLVHVFNEYMLKNGYAAAFDLSPRETEVLKWITCGMNKHEIADKLNISPRTAEVHTYRIREKLCCRNDAHVTAKALVFNLVE